jgi:UPF0755 protein
MKGASRVLVAGLIALVALAAVGFSGYRLYENAVHKHFRAGQAPISVTIPPGTSVSGVADVVQRAGLIDNALAFQAYVRLHGYSSRLEAGHYQVPGGTDIAGLVALIGHAQGNQVSVTIPEGYTSKQIADVMQQKGLFQAPQYLDAARAGHFNQDFVADRPAGSSLEGFLFPDTFFFSPKATPEDVVNAQLNRFGEVVTPDLRAHATDHKLTLYQALVLAAIVEREGRFDEDRGQIASVFYNRLAQGMPLQSDVTVAFAKGAPGSPITEADKSINSPYNTYLNTGLPPGPICNPGLASIVAALTPPSTDYLYFLTDKDSHAHFSRTLAEHQQQIIQYGVQ